MKIPVPYGDHRPTSKNDVILIPVRLLTRITRAANGPRAAAAMTTFIIQPHNRAAATTATTTAVNEQELELLLTKLTASAKVPLPRVLAALILKGLYFQFSPKKQPSEQAVPQEELSAAPLSLPPQTAQSPSPPPPQSHTPAPLFQRPSRRELTEEQRPRLSNNCPQNTEKTDAPVVAITTI